MRESSSWATGQEGVPNTSAPEATITEVRFEYASDALGIGVAQPRLSWMIATELAGWHQTGYEIEVYAVDGQLRDQTGLVVSDQSVLVAWPFAPLTSRERLTVRLRVWGSDGKVSAWSNPTTVEAGLLHPDDWSARFVTPAWEEDRTRANPAPLLRREFNMCEGMASARLYITALGVYEAQINGHIVGNHLLAPGWTSYPTRLLYQTFDVTDLLQPGHNVLGAILGDGWYRGRLGFGGGRRNIYGDQLALLAQLEITYTDGRSERVITDDQWRAATGPILASDLYDGETYDARLERRGWSEAGYDDRDWVGIHQVERDLGTLIAPSGPPVRCTDRLAPVATITSPTGRTIIDFGQNLVGRLLLTVCGDTGQTITAREKRPGSHALPFMASVTLKWTAGPANCTWLTYRQSSVILI
jgi:alpha-L-rhamnosidase